MTDDEEQTTCICDACGRSDFMSDEAYFPTEGEWQGCTLCPECIALEGNE